MRGIARTWSRLRLDWEIGLHRLPFFTQKVAVLLVAVLVATLALLGGVASLVGPPGADGPDRLVPGGSGGPPATTRPAPGRRGGRDAPGGAGGPAGAPDGARPAAVPNPRRGPAAPAATPHPAPAAPVPPPTTTTPPTSGPGRPAPLRGVVSSVVSTLLP